MNHLQGHLYKEDAGYFIVNLDRNSPKVLFDHVPQMYNLKELTEKQCFEDLYCGMPMYYPCASMLKYVYVVYALQIQTCQKRRRIGCVITRFMGF